MDHDFSSHRACHLSFELTGQTQRALPVGDDLIGGKWRWLG